MKKTSGLSFLFALLLGACVWVQAGELEPPGPPDSTMVTLQEIFDKLDGLGAIAAVPKTGQTVCWDQFGALIVCPGTGQDGESRAGVSVDPRFTDNGDGTVKDNLSGLIWPKEASCFNARIWIDALADANSLADGSCNLTDGSSAGDWRLPNIKELQSLIDYGQTAPSLPPGHPFQDVQTSYYWSSTSLALPPDDTNNAWVVWFLFGDVEYQDKLLDRIVWPVRGPQ